MIEIILLYLIVATFLGIVFLVVGWNKADPLESISYALLWPVFALTIIYVILCVLVSIPILILMIPIAFIYSMGDK